jgi:hypothetical protein
MKIARASRMNVISHWHKLFGNFSFSTQKFYDLVERALERRNIPGLEISRVDWKEGGLFSADREYLRLTREKLTYDICAAPFGTGFFFSSRLGETASSIGLFRIFFIYSGLTAVTSTINSVCNKLLGNTWWYIGVFIAAIIAIVWVIRKFISKEFSNLIIMLIAMNAIAATVIVTMATFHLFPKDFMGWVWIWGIVLFMPFLFVWFFRFAAGTGSRNFDAILLKIPIIGSVYEKYFRIMTFYRLDLVHAYQSAVHSAVLEAIDEVTKDAKGIRPLSEEERKPIMKSLYWK